MMNCKYGKSGLGGHMLVTLADGSTKQIYKLQAGDRLKVINTNNSSANEVEIAYIESYDTKKITNLYQVGSITCNRLTRFYNPKSRNFNCLPSDLVGTDSSIVVAYIEGKLCPIKNVKYHINSIPREIFNIQCKGNISNSTFMLVDDILIRVTPFNPSESL